jgi:integrase
VAHKFKTKLASRTARLALPVRKKPHDFANVDGERGLSIGYRRNDGAGTWVLRLSDGKGGASTSRLATADDYEDADNERVLDFRQACERARAVSRGAKGIAAPTTFSSALDAYEADLKSRGGDAASVNRVRKHLPAAVSSKLVGALTVAELRRWRDQLTESRLARGSVRRVMKVAGAALNHAASLDPRISDRSAWKTAFSGFKDAYTPINRVISDADVLKLVAEAYAVDAHFGLFIDVLASTGTRTSQACGLLVADLQESGASRLMMPSSRKGGGKKEVTRKPVPITASLARKLQAAAGERPGDAPLLVPADGQAWNPKAGLLIKLFAEAARRAGIEATAYSLRHSSIVRGLLANVPLRVVASQHDTSVTMIERTYSAFISDFADTVARKGLLDTPEPAGSNVLAIAAGRR